MTMADDIRCRGCWQLGNCCGECGHCLATARDGVLEIRRLQDERAAIRAHLLSIFDGADDFSGPDLKAAVADALETTVKKLEARK